MKVETYEVEEIGGSDASTMAADSAAIELSEKLGLAGQLSLTNKATDTRLPYRVMTNEESAVYGACFPNRTKVEFYSDGIMPLRVLQVVAHCKEAGFFQAIYVWHPARGVKDPVLVGLRKERPEGQQWDSEVLYILARWGESLEPLESLKKTAKKILMARWKAKLESTMSQCQAGLACVESVAENMLNGGDQKGDPYFSWT